MKRTLSKDIHHGITSSLALNLQNEKGQGQLAL
jgi:hypothetical protein